MAGGTVSNITTSGPTGANDNYMQVLSDSTGVSALTHLASYNTAVAWTTNDTAAGITAIQMDVKVFGVPGILARVPGRDDVYNKARVFFEEMGNKADMANKVCSSTIATS
jgi:hypothetical protein